MTENQYRQHAEIMKELRARFQKFWTDEILPALEDSDIKLDERGKAASMHNLWNAWRRPLVKGNPVWFLDPENQHKNQ